MSGVDARIALARRGIDLHLTVADGEVVAVLGPNGVGKSTVLQTIAGLVRPDSGHVRIGDEVVTDVAAGVFVPAHRRGVALLAQRPLLFPHLSVAANVAYGPRCSGLSRRAANERSRRWLDAVDAGTLAERRPARLSGGQAQRVALARALAAEPRLLLLDEPFAALDVGAAAALRRTVRDLLRQDTRSAVIVTHDVLDALAIADTAVVIEDGRIVEQGPVRSVLTAPRSDFAAGIAGMNLVSGVAGAQTLRTPWGLELAGTGDVEPGAAAVALFQPAAVAVHTEAPRASPRNVVPVTIADVVLRGNAVRIRGGDWPDGSPGPAADVTPAAVVDLGLEPGRQVFFVVKAQEVGLHPAPHRAVPRARPDRSADVR
ncbi:ABC transporter ATP-binding protein [Mycolicibacterium sp. 018/SC-01/001]|uniref:sulfate/molybdate ABC transporter ATP-binding protein n=1 Tax=Mycolicibacterium sp. 018/SC-01/001 TaxID=2592069 RepID=UPI00117E2406|nr:ABC transporter ATP-binding protein [Mycolicibacterium sp. 018/SC-01/001]TRW84811.1 ABC transporter ATP-binding protein [Mycolicibacterium sp. 018/SC-01/001]